MNEKEPRKLEPRDFFAKVKGIWALRQSEVAAAYGPQAADHIEAFIESKNNVAVIEEGLKGYYNESEKKKVRKELRKDRQRARKYGKKFRKATGLRAEDIYNCLQELREADEDAD